MESGKLKVKEFSAKMIQIVGEADTETFNSQLSTVNLLKNYVVSRICLTIRETFVIIHAERGSSRRNCLRDWIDILGKPRFSLK